MTGRYFRGRQRAALYIASDGLCVDCGQPLERDWEADHVTPHSKGGPTDIANGAARCPRCHRDKTSKEASVPTYRVTAALAATALEDFMATTGPFPIVAIPAAGKTNAAFAIARTLLDAGAIDRIAAIVPTATLRQQTATEAGKWGIKLDVTDNRRMALEPRGHNGTVATYATVAGTRLHQIACSRGRTLLIADEPHHMGEHADWGRAIAAPASLARRDGFS